MIYNLKWHGKKGTTQVEASSLTEAKLRFIRISHPNLARLTEKLLDSIVEVE